MQGHFRLPVNMVGPQGTRIPVARKSNFRRLRCVAHQSYSESHSKGGKSTGGRGRQHKEAEVL